MNQLHSATGAGEGGPCSINPALGSCGFSFLFEDDIAALAGTAFFRARQEGFGEIKAGGHR